MYCSVKNYNSIDLVKFLLSFVVISIHTLPDYMKIGAIKIIQDASVPIFFCFSGFLFSNSRGSAVFARENTAECKDVLKRTIIMYIKWSIIYIPLTIYGYIFVYDMGGYWIIHFIRQMLFVGENYNSWALWYLLALIYSYSICFVFNRFNINKMIFMIFIPFIYILGVMLNGNIDFLLLNSIRFVFGGTGRIFTGVAYFMTGVVLYRCANKVRLLYVFVSMALSLVCAVSFNGVIYDFAITTLVLFSCILVLHVHLTDSRVWFFMRKISTYNYFIHLWIWTIYYTLVYKEKHFGLDSFIVTSLLSFAISILIIAAKNKVQKRR